MPRSAAPRADAADRSLPGVGDDAAVDGRRLRSERSRQAVIEALLGLYDAGIVRPSAAQIAEAAGISERSLFRHFTDLEDVASAALDRHWRDVAPYFADPPADGTLAERIDALVRQRVRLTDRIANMARAATFHAVSSPTIAQGLADRRALLRTQIERQFAPELDAVAKRGQRLLVAALDQALSAEAIDYLRSPSGGRLGARDLRASLTATTTALLHHANQPQESR